MYKICDLGISKQNQVATTMFVGTPYYIAPEILSRRGGTYSYQVDIWALGLVLYEVFTGTTFFNGIVFISRIG